LIEKWDGLDWDILEEICKESLLKFVIDVILKKIFFNFLKCIKCKFTNLINNKF